jgi:hypothetical protein
LEIANSATLVLEIGDQPNTNGELVLRMHRIP